MSKLTDFENPLSGKKGSIFSFSDWWSLVLGMMVILIVAWGGQKLASTVTGNLPGGVGAGFATNPMGTNPAVPAAAPKKVIY